MRSHQPVESAIGILIPSHDESTVIGETVVNTRAIAPGCPIHVIADRCTDNTAEQARASGATVWERHGGAPGKGAALRWFVETAAPALVELNAVLILDADSRLRPGAVQALADSLASGATAAQGFVQPVFNERSPAAVLAAYSEWLSQALDDRIRSRLAWPVPLRGTGMAFRTEVLRDLAPALRTRAEDIELTLLLASKGHRVVFVPRAEVEDPKPNTGARLGAQRTRWLQGQREVWRVYRRTILRLAATGGPGVWWLLSALLMKPRTLVIAAKAAAILLLGWLPVVWTAVGIVRLLFMISLALDVARYLVGLLLVPRSWRHPLLTALAYSPVYALMWLRSLIMSFTSREAWLRTRD